MKTAQGNRNRNQYVHINTDFVCMGRGLENGLAKHPTNSYKILPQSWNQYREVVGLRLRLFQRRQMVQRALKQPKLRVGGHCRIGAVTIRGKENPS